MANNLNWDTIFTTYTQATQDGADAGITINLDDSTCMEVPYPDYATTLGEVLDFTDKGDGPTLTLDGTPLGGGKTFTYQGYTFHIMHPSEVPTADFLKYHATAQHETTGASTVFLGAYIPHADEDPGVWLFVVGDA